MRTEQRIETPRGAVRVIHDATLADVEACPLDGGLTSLVHSPIARRGVLRNLAADPGARLTLAVAGGAIVGHVAVGRSFGRWQALPRVREVAFEVAREWRRLGLLARLVDVALADPAVEHEILLAFLWPSAWDVEGTALQPTTYRRLLERLGARRGFLPVPTDEPEIALGGSLIVRVGARVPYDAVEALDGARILGRGVRAAA